VEGEENDNPGETMSPDRDDFQRETEEQELEGLINRSEPSKALAEKAQTGSPLSHANGQIRTKS